MYPNTRKHFGTMWKKALNTYCLIVVVTSSHIYYVDTNLFGSKSSLNKIHRLTISRFMKMYTQEINSKYQARHNLYNIIFTKMSTKRFFIKLNDHDTEVI